MNPWLIVIILGIVEGFTEFLPVSSTGHLIIVGEWLGHTGPKAGAFKIMIQSGAILAVVWKYKQRFFDLCSRNSPKKFSGLWGIYLIFLSTIPILFFGALGYPFIKKYLMGSPLIVSIALALGGIGLILSEYQRKETNIYDLDELTPNIAFQIGIWQCLALCPGVSRSGATIVGGLTKKMDRRLAAEYSFLIGVPALLAATAFEMLKSFHQFSLMDMMFLGLGLIVSFFSALLAIHLFLKILKNYSLKCFGYYRIILAVIVFIFLVVGKISKTS